MPPSTPLPHRDAILAAFHAALSAADPARAFRRFCRVDWPTVHLGDDEQIRLSPAARVWLVGAGKATYRLAAAAEEAFGEQVAGGVITLREGEDRPPLRAATLRHAGHPLPDEASVAAADDSLAVARNALPEDLLLCLLSGGASALWAAPPEGIALADLTAMTRDLLRSGAPITEVNTVRRHLSRIAGGRLAAATRARVVTLAISDVIAAPEAAIGSGPTVLDVSTTSQVRRILSERGIDPAVSIVRYLDDRSAGKEPAAPDGPPSSFHVIASIRDAIDAAAGALRAGGRDVEVVDSAVQGEAREVARGIVEAATAARRTGRARLAQLWGGETTVTVRGNGTGGRNQELALAAALQLRGIDGITIASLATDGSDGPTTAAGAFADSGTVGRAIAHGYDPVAALETNDSYPLLQTTGDLVTTGPTGTNVNDLVFALID